MDFRATLGKTEKVLVDEVYFGGRKGNSSDDPLHPLIGVSNQGGFRIFGTKYSPTLIVLISNLKDPDWPDFVDKENGLFIYYGDNKKPGHELHETPRYGNFMLRSIFEKSHGNKFDRKQVPPILVFTKTGNFRDVQFEGLVVPGTQDLDSNSDLVAIWKLKNGKRFQNYQAKFTILNEPAVTKLWITDIKNGNPLSENCPETWRMWVNTGRFKILKAPKVFEYRRKEEQIPKKESEFYLIKAVQEYFAKEPFKFEACAAKIAEMALENISSIDLTRPTKDGGRDAIGKYRIGSGDFSVLVDFALEAKCYTFENAVAVKELSRLISRLRHRQFGILVTTSYVALQAYQEIKEDEHPIVIIAANDMVKIFMANGLGTIERLSVWLQTF